MGLRVVDPEASGVDRTSEILEVGIADVVAAARQELDRRVTALAGASDAG